MSVVNRWEVKLIVRRPCKPTLRVVEKTRDMMILSMRRDGISWRIIGGCLGISHEHARQRWAEIQAVHNEAGENYRQAAVG